MKKFISFFLVGLFLFPLSVGAYTQDEAKIKYKAELKKLALEEPGLSAKVTQDIDNLINGMESAQYDVDVAFKALDTRIKGLLKNDGRREAAKSALSEAETKVKAFTKMEAQNELDVQPVTAGALPQVLPLPGFSLAQTDAQTAMNDVNRILIGPERPGAVPEGDLVSDFLPQLIRQLFRFAWLVIFIAFTVSGVMLVMAKDKEERVTQAKDMIFYSFIGFAVITLAFAIVKAVTDIDFFAFI